MTSTESAGEATASKVLARRHTSLAERLRPRGGGIEMLKPHLASIGHLLSGNFGGVMIMMASLAIATRSLGQEQFGIFAVILSIGRVCERLIRFESWQPLVRFVAAEEEKGDMGRISSLYAYGLLLDVGSALIAAVMSVVVGWLAGDLIGLGRGNIDLVAIYACAIACNPRGMSSAALRLSGRFRTLAYVQLASFVARFFLAVLLYILDADLVWFVLVWTVSQIFDSALFNLLGFRALSDTGVPSPLKADRRNLPARFPGFMRFAISTNLSSTLRTMTHEMDTLLVSTFAGPGAAGLYYLSRRIARVAQTAGDMIQTVIYPDLARLWSKVGPGKMGQLVSMLQLSLAAIALGALGACWLIGRPAIELVFGPGFSDSYELLLIQLVAVLLTLHTTPARAALLAMNRPTFVLITSFVSAAAFFAAAFVLIPRFGALGANYAHIAFGVANLILLDTAFWRGLRKAEREDRANAATVPSHEAEP
ncbi:lipopolysaccharide biosynthesis protein [Novosphingobium sp. ZW T3_23]|uniref:lipopolysaccharide biosynthesis protein n=1 Tax=Novosphingobium sp. ZW T3_23 TaxID=3378084 RepID=UPI0038527E31